MCGCVGGEWVWVWVWVCVYTHPWLYCICKTETAPYVASQSSAVYSLVLHPSLLIHADHKSCVFIVSVRGFQVRRKW